MPLAHAERLPAPSTPTSGIRTKSGVTMAASGAGWRMPHGPGSTGAPVRKVMRKSRSTKKGKARSDGRTKPRAIAGKGLISSFIGA